MKAIYPGTFDPITRGHSDIILRASQLFDEVIVAVARSTAKTTAFSTDERVAMAQKALEGMKNVTITAFGGLMINFAREQNARVVIRGLRAVSDFEYEFQMASMNRQLCEECETVFLTPHEQYGYISSSLVRQIAQLGGDVSRFVHPAVDAALRDRFSS